MTRTSLSTVCIHAMLLLSCSWSMAGEQRAPLRGFIDDESEILVLVKIVRVDVDNVPEKGDQNFGFGLGLRVKYGAEAICEMTGRLKPGTRLTISGDLASNGTMHSTVAKLHENDLAVMCVDRGDDPAAYLYKMDDNCRLPLGLRHASEKIPAHDKDAVVEALGIVRTLRTRPLDVLEGVNELLSSKNYYIWAMGVWILADSADVHDTISLETMSGDELSLRQALWLTDQLQHTRRNLLVSDDRHLYEILRLAAERAVQEEDTSAAAPVTRAVASPSTSPMKK